MSTSFDGLQFPIHPGKHKPSTSSTGKQIIAEALATVDHQSSVDALAEKNFMRGVVLSRPAFGTAELTSCCLSSMVVWAKGRTREGHCALETVCLDI